MAAYLVTGGCGFIGSHLVEALLGAGHGVKILDDLSTGHLSNVPAAAEVVVGDVADPSEVERALAGCEGCFHLAAVASVERSVQDWLGTHRTNATGTVTVLDAARRRRVPVVYASSAAVFGDNPDVPLSESSATRPQSAYGADKLASELHARVARLVHGVPTVGMRFFNVYGPRQDPRSPYSGVISIFCDRLLQGREITIFGDGGQIRDFVYVGDVVKALLLAMDRLPIDPAVFCVASGHGTTVRELAGTIARLCNATLKVQHAPPRAGEIRTSIGDPTAARHQLGFIAATTLEEGLASTLSHLREGLTTEA